MCSGESFRKHKDMWSNQMDLFSGAVKLIQYLTTAFIIFICMGWTSKTDTPTALHTTLLNSNLKLPGGLTSPIVSFFQTGKKWKNQGGREKFPWPRSTSECIHPYGRVKSSQRQMPCICHAYGYKLLYQSKDLVVDMACPISREWRVEEPGPLLYIQEWRSSNENQSKIIPKPMWTRKCAE